MDEYVIEYTVDCKINKSRLNRFVKYGDNQYQVRCYGLKIDEDTREPVKQLSRTQVLSYCKLKKIVIPGDIGKSDDC